jgi:hypothetical protein
MSFIGQAINHATRSVGTLINFVELVPISPKRTQSQDIDYGNRLVHHRNVERKFYCLFRFIEQSFIAMAVNNTRKLEEFVEGSKQCFENPGQLCRTLHHQ